MIKEKFLIFRKVEKPSRESLKAPAKVSARPAAERVEVRRDSQASRAGLADTSASELIETTPELSIEEKTRSVLEVLINAYTTNEKIKDLFDPTKMTLDIALDALVKIKPEIIKKLQEGYKFESYSENGLLWHWSKEGKGIVEINPLVKNQEILKVMSLKGKEALEKLQNNIMMTRVKQYIDEHILKHLGKFRPNINSATIYSSYLIREEVIPILVAGYQEGARPYKFVATANGFRLQSDIAIFHTHEFVLSDYTWDLNLRPQAKPEYDEHKPDDANQLLNSVNLDKISDDIGAIGQRLKEDAERENKFIDEALAEHFSAEMAAADELTNSPGHAHAGDPEDLPAVRDAVYEQLDNLSAKNELLAEDAADIREYMDYLYQATNGGRNTPSSEEDRTRLMESWPGYQDLEGEIMGALHIAQQEGDYEYFAAARIQNRLFQYYMVQLGFRLP